MGKHRRQNPKKRGGVWYIQGKDIAKLPEAKPLKPTRVRHKEQARKIRRPDSPTLRSWKQALARVRKLGLDPVPKKRGKRVALSKIRRVSDLSIKARREINRLDAKNAYLFEHPHIVAKIRVPPKPKAGTRNYKVRKQKYDLALSRLKAAQELGGHKVFDPTIQRAVIPVIDADPKKKKAHLAWSRKNRPVLVTADGRREHVSLDFERLERDPDGYAREIIAAHPGKRFQIVTGGAQHVQYDADAVVLAARLKALMDSDSGQNGQYRSWLRGLMVYTDTVHTSAVRAKRLNELRERKASYKLKTQAEREAYKRAIARKRKREQRHRDRR